MKTFENKNIALLLLRLSLGILMLLHGLFKLTHGIGFIQSMLIQKHLPVFISYGVFIGEVIAPLALILGFRTRIAALILAINMLFIMFVFLPASQLFSLNMYGGWQLELQGLYLSGALALFFMGGGNIAVSHKKNWD